MLSDSPPPPAPRRFRLGAVDAATAFLLMFGAIWTGVGLAISIAFTAAGGPFWSDLVLDRRGRTVTATPVDVLPTSAHLNGRMVQEVTYGFVDAAGTSRTGASGTTDPAVIAVARAKQPVEIDYDPADPTLSRLHGGSASFFGLFVLFPFAFFVVGAIVLAAGVRRALARRAVYVHGVPVRATVTGVRPTSMRVNGRRVMRIDYEFDGPTGRATGNSTSRKAPPVGATLWVLHDPQDPRRNVAA